LYKLSIFFFELILQPGYGDLFFHNIAYVGFLIQDLQSLPASGETGLILSIVFYSGQELLMRKL